MQKTPADIRPEPDEAAEVPPRRGELRIFFGAAPGVGKTWALLQAAQRLAAAGRRVLIGCVETHGRPELLRLLADLPVLPQPGPGDWRRRPAAELDLAAVLRQRPDVVIVDELAHHNPPGARHRERWQDVLELLDAGIDVCGTLGVQHLSSLSDVVAGITQARARETVPDRLLERADAVELIDLLPDELLERLRQGKVHLPEGAQSADRSFRRGSLLALRELSLRCVAEHVDRELVAYRAAHGIADTWAATERLLVCVGPSPLCERVVRAARRMAAGLRAPWIAVYVETPAHERLGPADRARLERSLRLAESLGAEVVTLGGTTVARAVLDYARDHNITKIVLGKPTHPRWRDVLRGALVDDLIRGSGDIDVYVITGEPGTEPRPRRGPRRLAAPPAAYGLAALLLLPTTLLALLIDRTFGLPEVEAAMIYLLGIVVSALRCGRGPALLTSALSVAVFNYAFVAPRYTVAVADVRSVFSFGGMFAIGLVISSLAARARWQADRALERERSTSALYALTQALGRERDTAALAKSAARHVADSFRCRALVLLPSGEGRAASLSGRAAAPKLEPVGSSGDLAFDDAERELADWVFSHNTSAGLGTATRAEHPSLLVPLLATDRCLGVLVVRPRRPGPIEDPDDRASLQGPAQRGLLLAFCNQIATALARALWAEEAQRTARRAEREELRNTLLSSVSHDLRTPLAAIAGAASTLLHQEERPAGAPAQAALTPALRRELLQTVCDEAEHLNRLVRNLLDMTRLEFGGLLLRKEWIPLSEVVGSALNRLEQRLGMHRVTVSLPKDLPLLPMDPVLAEQLFHNLIENAIKYTPPATPIEISAAAGVGMVTVAVADRGPGIPPDAEERVFEKFFRGPYQHSEGGVGLGLTICRGIVEAHGGQISAANRSGGGAVFCFTLPIEGEPPPLPPDADADTDADAAADAVPTPGGAPP
ncbi:MAG: sensor histidine kinase KdpD [Polyangia bacterium]